MVFISSQDFLWSSYWRLSSRYDDISRNK